MASTKYYVVWKGKTRGIFTSWEDCKAQVEGFEGARYKGFSSAQEAEKALAQGEGYLSNGKSTAGSSSPFAISYRKDALSVDAACSGNPGNMEYRGVWIENRQELFRIGPYQEGTNNIGEFLAIVHALAFLNQRQMERITVYTDSMTAISWVKSKKCKTKLERTEINTPIFELIQRAELWLQNHTWTHLILKWDTRSWGEIPADFGRK